MGASITAPIIYVCLLLKWIWYNRVKTLLCGRGAMEANMQEYNDPDRTCGLTDDEVTERFRAAVRLANEKKKIKGVPIARLDANGKSYLEYPDGSKKYVAD